MQPRLVADYACNTGENPLWHPDEGCVYWVDIPAGRLFRYYPDSGRHEMCWQGDPVGGFTIQADGSLLLFMARGAVKVWRDGRIVDTVIAEIPEERETRFNDVMADPAGRVLCGTMPGPNGRPAHLYRLEVDGALTLLLDDVGLSNGMGFTADHETLYYTDTMRYTIYRFGYDVATGELGARQAFVTVPPGQGGPDGMTVDAKGCVWSARWGASCVVRYDPDGREMERVTFSMPKVSCPSFGGPDYGDLYVTTAGGDQKETDGAEAGALFVLRPAVGGVPEFRSRIGL